MKKAVKDLEAKMKVKREGVETKIVECTKLKKDKDAFKKQVDELIVESEIRK